MGKFLEVFEDALKLVDSISLTGNGVSRFPYNFSRLRYSDAVKASIHQLLLESLLKAEKKFPGSSTSVIKNFSDDQGVKEHLVLKNIKRETLKSRLTEEFGVDVCDICFTAAELSGIDGKIFLKKNPVSIPTLELKTSYKFQCSSPTGEFDFSSSKILVIDGFIESVSQIHRLLTELSETGQECVLFCRGLSPDVTNTISVNLKRSLKLRPLIVQFNESGINTLKDICVVSKSVLHTSDLGHTVSSVNVDKDSRNFKLKFNGNQVFVEVNEVDDGVRNHLLDLRNKMESCEEEFTLELYKKRIESLSGRQVTIFLPDNVGSYMLTQKIDSCLRKMRGLISVGDLREDQERMMVQPIINSLKEYSRQFEECEGLHHELFIA